MAGLFVKIARKQEKVLLVTIRGRGGVTEKNSFGSTSGPQSFGWDSCSGDSMGRQFPLLVHRILHRSERNLQMCVNPCKPSNVGRTNFALTPTYSEMLDGRGLSTIRQHSLIDMVNSGYGCQTVRR